MIDAIFYLLISVLAACLLTLATVPVVHRRAVRLTLRRIEAAAPRSMSEIQAQQDQTRAEFAMSMRQLEVKLETLKNKSVEQRTEVARRDNLIVQLKNKICEQNAAIVALEAQQKAIRDQLRVSEEELAIKSYALVEAQQDLAEQKRRGGTNRSSADRDTQDALAGLAAILEKAGRTWEEDRVENARLREAVEQMASQVGQLTRPEREDSLSASIIPRAVAIPRASQTLHEH
jgi:hypothetical protein